MAVPYGALCRAKHHGGSKWRTRPYAVDGPYQLMAIVACGCQGLPGEYLRHIGNSFQIAMVPMQQPDLASLRTS
jgi:hypothetical protein